MREEHLPLARQQVGTGATILAQPLDRGTAPGVLWPLVHVLRRDPMATVVVSPSDHGVRDPDAYRRGLVEAAEAAGGSAAVLLGVEATAPRTDYGWIVPGEELRPGVFRVGAFVEKPLLPAARALEAMGALFSTMVLVARAHALLAALELVRPGLAALLLPLASLPPIQRAIHLRRAYALMPSCDFSAEVLPHAPDLAVVRWPSHVGWSDLGTPERLSEWLAHDAGVPEAVA